MKQLCSVILILLCFIFLLACANANAGSGSDPQSDTGETIAPIQNDDPSDATDADKTTQPSITDEDLTASPDTTDADETTQPNITDEPVTASPDTTDADETTQPNITDESVTASPVTLAPDETIPPQSVDSTDRSMLLLEESNKLYSSFEKDPEDASKLVYPDDYAGTYDGDDGYLHIMLTSLDNIDHYKAIVDPSLVQFHTVKYSFNQLFKVIDPLEEKMQEYNLLYPPYVKSGANIVTIQTYSSDMVDDIKAFLDAESIDPDLYEIVIYENGVISQ